MNRRGFLRGVVAAIVAAPAVARLELRPELLEGELGVIEGVTFQSTLFDYGQWYSLALRVERRGLPPWRHAVRIPWQLFAHDLPPERVIRDLKAKLLRHARRQGVLA